MALNDITAVLGQGFSIPLQGERHISGLVAGIADIPSGASIVERVSYKLTQLADAEDLGIVYSDPLTRKLHYQIDRFFIKCPGGVLWLMVVNEDNGTFQWDEVEMLQNDANGKIRQVGITTETLMWDTSHVAFLNQQAINCFDKKQPLVVFYAPYWYVSVSGTPTAINLADFPDARALDCRWVSIVIGMDGDGTGSAIAASVIGATLGLTAKMPLSNSIAYVKQCKMTDTDNEMDVPAFITGDLFKDVSPTLISDLNTYGYIFLRPIATKSGTWLNDSHNCALSTDNFNQVERTAVMAEAWRNIYYYTIDHLNGPLNINPNNGQLSAGTVAFLETEAERGLLAMQTNGDISGAKVTIDPTQNVLQTSNVKFKTKIVPIGVGRAFEFTLEYALKL